MVSGASDLEKIGNPFRVDSMLARLLSNPFSASLEIILPMDSFERAATPLAKASNDGSISMVVRIYSA